MWRRTVLLAALAPACRFHFDVSDTAGGDARTGNGDQGITGDGNALTDDSSISPDAASSFVTLGVISGPLVDGSSCGNGTAAGNSRRLSLFGDLPKGASQDQTVTVNEPAALSVNGDYGGGGQAPLVDIAIIDPQSVMHALTADGTAYGTYCTTTAILGTYTIHITNVEPSQTARNLIVTISAGSGVFATCPYAGC